MHANQPKETRDLRLTPRLTFRFQDALKNGDGAKTV